MLGVDWSAPRYMIREGLQRGKLRKRIGRRVLSFKRRLEEGMGNEIARRCWKEIKGEERKRPVEEERKGYFLDRGVD